MVTKEKGAKRRQLIQNDNYFSKSISFALIGNSQLFVFCFVHYFFFLFKILLSLNSTGDNDDDRMRRRK